MLTILYILNTGNKYNKIKAIIVIFQIILNTSQYALL